MKDDLTPATKGDIQRLDREIQQLEARVTRKLEDLEATMLHHFNLAVETIRHDLLGVHRDQVEVLKDRQHDHEQRILVLERSAGLVGR
jgi:hypothetical protein